MDVNRALGAASVFLAAITPGLLLILPPVYTTLILDIAVGLNGVAHLYAPSSSKQAAPA
jgi:hypothetical protein